MLKKIAFVLGLLAAAYLLGQNLPAAQNDSAAKHSVNDTTIGDEPHSEQQIARAQPAKPKDEKDYLLGSDLLFTPSDEVAAFGLWLGEFSGQSEFSDQLLSKVETLHAVVQLPFINSLQQKRIILLMGPYTSLSAAQLDQQKLLHSLQINATVVKFPTIEKTKT